jgi:hypothetical protein
MCGDVAPCLNNCLGHGTCSAGQCTCDAGWFGTDCSGSCHASCATCTGSANSQCVTCNGLATPNTDTGACDCANTYVEPTGDCIDSDCPRGTFSDSASSCVVPDTVAVSFDLNAISAWPLASTGYNPFSSGTEVVATATACAPWSIEGRGIYLDSSSSHYFTTNIDMYEDFTLQTWIKPTASSGSIFNWQVNRGYSNGNLWVSDCDGLVLDYGT